MKIVLCSLFAASVTAFIHGGTFTNEGPAGMKIIWAVPTNIWPVDKIWTYKVIPQQFSDTVVSNAMALGGFTLREKIKLPPEQPCVGDMRFLRAAKVTEVRLVTMCKNPMGIISHAFSNPFACECF